MLLTTVAFARSNAQKPPGKPKSPDNPLGAFNNNVYGRLKVVLLNSAQKMPERSNVFKPTAAVCSYSQIVGQVADARYMFCSIELGEKNPAPRVEQTKTLKADLVATLKDAFACCDKAYNAITDASATETVQLFGSGAHRLGVLATCTIWSITATS